MAKPYVHSSFVCVCAGTVTDCTSIDLQGVGKDLDLDTQTGVGDLKSESYPNEWHPHNLLPLIYKDPDTERTRFETVMRKVTDAIQKCRSTKHIETSSDFLRDLNNARDALQGTHEARREDQAAKCIQDINSKLQDSGVDWVSLLCPFLYLVLIYNALTLASCKSVETQRVTGAVTGTTWEEMDTEATLRAHPDATDNVRAGVLGWVNGFNSEEGDNANHYKWIQNIQQQSFRVYGDPDC